MTSLREDRRDSGLRVQAPARASAWPALGGVISLMAVYVTMLAGRFTLDRVMAVDFAIDLRWPLITATGLIVAMWFAASAPRLQARTSMTGMIFFLCWAMWMTISGAWAVPSSDTMGTFENFVLLAALTALGIAVVSRLPLSAFGALWWLLFATAAVYLAGAVALGGVSGRLSAFGGGPNVFVRIMVLGAIAAVALALRGRRSWPLFLAPVFGLGAILSGSRGGVLAAVIVVVLAFIPIMIRLGLKRSIWLSVILAASALTVPRILGEAQLQLMYTRFIVLPFREGALGSRDVLAEAAFEMFLAHPILGAGVGTFEAQNGLGLHPHNLVLATAAEGGIVGVLLLAGTLLAFLIGILRSRPLGVDGLVLLLCGLYIFGAALFSGDYYDSRFMWFFLAAGVCAARSGASEHQAVSRIPAS